MWPDLNQGAPRAGPTASRRRMSCSSRWQFNSVTLVPLGLLARNASMIVSMGVKPKANGGVVTTMFHVS